MERAYDAIVVGSGFGGGIAACRLAEQGLRVCVLERGRRFGPGDYPDRLAQFPHALWHARHNPGGMFDVRIMKDVAVVTGAGVGGGSLVYANVQLRAPDEIFDDPAWPAAINAAELDRFYTRTEEALDPQITPRTPAPLPKVAAFEAMARASGREAIALPIAVHFGEDRHHPFSGVFQRGCDNLGRCDVGCPRMSKNTIDITYVARAETLGAEVYPLHEARDIRPPVRDGDAWRVGFAGLQYKTKGEVRAPLLVLAAGTLGSTRLLLKNHRRLSKLSPALGSRYSGNGDALALALDPTARARQGRPHRVRPRHDEPHRRARRARPDGRRRRPAAQLRRHPRGAARCAGADRSGPDPRRRQERRDEARLLGPCAHAPALTPRDMRVRRRPPIGDSLIFLCIGRDAADGRARLTPLFKRFDVHFDRVRGEALFHRMRETVGELCQAAGATAFFALDAGPLGKYVTSTRSAAARCPTIQRTASSTTTARSTATTASTCSTARSSRRQSASTRPKTIAALAERGVERLLAERGRASGV